MAIRGVDDEVLGWRRVCVCGVRWDGRTKAGTWRLAECRVCDVRGLEGL